MTTTMWTTTRIGGIVATTTKMRPIRWMDMENDNLPRRQQQHVLCPILIDLVVLVVVLLYVADARIDASAWRPLCIGPQELLFSGLLPQSISAENEFDEIRIFDRANNVLPHGTSGYFNPCASMAENPFRQSCEQSNKKTKRWGLFKICSFQYCNCRKQY